MKDSYPLPIINTMLNAFQSARVFSKMDLSNGYYQVAMHPDSSKYTAFKCEFGFFEYLVMPMGCKNPSSSFQRMMDEVLNGLIGVCCFVYMDDIFVFSDSLEDHAKHLKQIHDRLLEHDLMVKLKKCEFYQQSITFLGHHTTQSSLMRNQKANSQKWNVQPQQSKSAAS